MKYSKQRGRGSSRMIKCNVENCTWCNKNGEHRLFARAAGISGLCTGNWAISFLTFDGRDPDSCVINFTKALAVNSLNSRTRCQIYCETKTCFYIIIILSQVDCTLKSQKFKLYRTPSRLCAFLNKQKRCLSKLRSLQIRRGRIFSKI